MFTVIFSSYKKETVKKKVNWTLIMKTLKNTLESF